MVFATGCGCAATGAATVGFGVAACSLVCVALRVCAALWDCALFCTLLGTAACVCGGAASLSTGRGFTTGWVIAVTELATTELVLAAFLLAYS